MAGTLFSVARRREMEEKRKPGLLQWRQASSCMAGVEGFREGEKAPGARESSLGP